MPIFSRRWIPAWVQITSGRQVQILPAGLWLINPIPSRWPGRLPRKHQLAAGTRSTVECYCGKRLGHWTAYEKGHLGNPNGLLYLSMLIARMPFICCSNVLHNSGDSIHTPRSHLPSAGSFPQKNSTAPGKFYLILTCFRSSVLPPVNYLKHPYGGTTRK